VGLMGKLRSSPCILPLKSVYRYSRRVFKSTLGKDHLISKDVRVPKIRLGQDWGDWVIADRLVSADSVVYSVGIGEDISFDLELIRRYGCRVYGWDPTPLATNFMASVKTPLEFTFLPYGLGSTDCAQEFGGKVVGDRSFSSHSLNPSKVSLDIRKLTSMMSMLNHDRVDILKMDIEGDEYDVVRQIVEDKIIVSQLLIEFHHGWYRIPVEKTREHIAMLKRAGYLIFDIDAVGREFSFIHKTVLNLAIERRDLEVVWLC
jgi:FkbM family methyltransferase